MCKRVRPICPPNTAFRKFFSSKIFQVTAVCGLELYEYITDQEWSLPVTIIEERTAASITVVLRSTYQLRTDDLSTYTYIVFFRL